MPDTRYKFNFTAGSAMLNEMQSVAEELVACDGDWSQTAEQVMSKNLMHKEKPSTNRRYFSLMQERLRELNDDELKLLIEGAMPVKRQMILLAICKSHSLVFDFISEMIRELFYSQNEKVTPAHFNEFFHTKKYEHPELEEVTENTVYKMRQVLFLILEQLEIIESRKTGIINRPYLSQTVEETITKDNPQWLAGFLYSNSEINILADAYGN